MKDWLSSELERNHARAELYTRLLRKAFADKKELQVMIGHHLTIMYEGKLETEDEIPSADCMMFDHDIMGRVFGERATGVVQALALYPVDGGRRDYRLSQYLDELENI